MEYNHHHNATEQKSCCAPRHKTDWMLIVSCSVILASLAVHFFAPNITSASEYGGIFAQSIVELAYRMWWGILLGIIAVGILGGIPRNLITSILGKGGTFSGILRATAAGVLLDLCSHGILLVGTKLYERGASLGQVMAFLIASPWNSLSLTLILWSLVGFKWMMMFLLLSLVIALISGALFDWLVKKGVLPANPNKSDLPEHFDFWKELKIYLRTRTISIPSSVGLVIRGVKESKMILRWIFFGIVLAAAIRTFVDPEMFNVLFGPTLAGLGATLLFATILEVCSEGSLPVATDMLTRAKAPGNAFAFLMTGVSTDYTEILALKETTKSWKISFYLPLVTLPQVIILALVLNGMLIP